MVAPPVPITFPGIVEASGCEFCRFRWHVVTDHRPIEKCMRWRRLAHERCREFEARR